MNIDEPSEIALAKKILRIFFSLEETLSTKKFDPGLGPILCEKYQEYVQLEIGGPKLKLKDIVCIYFLKVDYSNFRKLCYRLFGKINSKEYLNR